MCDEHPAQFMRGLFDNAEVVWCVWPDAEKDHTFHCAIVKGACRIGWQATTAFLVPNSNCAEIMRIGVGDGAQVITHGMPSVMQ